jgi:hypothetical protein
MRPSKYMRYDDRDGTLYFTQSNAVFALLADGTMHYYFGNETGAGDRAAEPYGAVDRLAARTSSPAQIAIDEEANVMYVAEMQMGTVRQINMTTGAASVFVGYFESYVFPPTDCLSQSCLISNVTFILPTAVAVYRPKSVAQRWVYVGDFTAAVVYRIVVETGEVKIVAGVMLSSGTVDGAAGVSKLMGISSFAVGVHDGVLYIADNSLRKLELGDVVAPLPPIVPTAVVTGTTTAVVTSTLVMGLVNPTAVTQASRANTIMTLGQCQRDFGSLPVYIHLLRFPIGDDPDFQYFTGAVVGNLVLCVGTVLLNALMVFIYATARGKSAVEACGALKFPSLVSLPLLFVLQPTVSVSVALFLYSNSWMLVLGVLGFIACIVTFLAVAVYFLLIFDGINDFEMLDKKYSGLMARMINPAGEWLQTDLTARMGMFFEDYLPATWWFVVVELGMCVVAGVLEGLKPEEFQNCLIVVGLATVLYTVFFVALLYYQPYTVRVTFYIRLAIAFLQMIATFLVVAFVKTGDAKWEASSTSFALGSLYLTTVDAMFSLLTTIRDTWEFLHTTGSVPEPNTAVKWIPSDDDDASSVELVERESTPARIVNGSFEAGSVKNESMRLTAISPKDEGSNSSFHATNHHELLRSELQGLMLEREHFHCSNDHDTSGPGSFGFSCASVASPLLALSWTTGVSGLMGMKPSPTSTSPKAENNSEDSFL